MAKKNTLIIVESPTKAKTISKFVGSGFSVKSSFGHIRDLPKRQLGIDVEHNFEPKYVIPLKAKTTVSALRRDAAKASRVILATDEDREGEAIAWHLAQALGLGQRPTTNDQRPTTEAISRESSVAPVERITFDEITKKAILEALENPRDINQKLVDAQQGRRVLDRLVGYKLSPLLWKKISKGLSAGRVQSVALRFIVDRERERQAFKPEEYWTIEALLAKSAPQGPWSLTDGVELPVDVFIAKLVKLDGKAMEKFAIQSKENAKKIADALEGALWVVSAVAQKEVKRNPLPPFITSTLQQTAGRRFGFSSKQTMRLAQMLYEGMDIGEGGTTGLITYMRTDSVNLSTESLEGARAFIENSYGRQYTEGAPRRYITKSRLAQEAHEAIRPTDPARTPESVKTYLEPRVWKLYDLVWRRFIASQMPPARFLETDVSISAKNHTFSARGMVKQFDGYQKVYAMKTKEVILPELAENDALHLLKLNPLQHFTEPLPRYNEASLIKTLEEFGIGRPSTYAPTISVIQDRGYVQKDEKRYFFPADIGYAVNDLLVEHFPLIVDPKFTAKMEEDLDKVASGEASWQDIIREFYVPFAQELAVKHESIEKMVEETKTECEKCGKPMVIRMGRFGRFMACSGFPDCKNTKPLPGSASKSAASALPKSPEGFFDKLKVSFFGKSKEAAGKPQESGGERGEDAEGGVCEKCGAALVERRGRFGPFWGCSRYPDCTYIKKQQRTIGMRCPKCSEGDVVMRRTKSRKMFYGCSRYPACDFASWTRPGADPAAGT